MTCAGHGVAMPPRPQFCPENTCWYCHLPFPPPFVPPPPKDCPQNFTPGAYVDGVMRNSSGHISGILWGELRGANAHLLSFKDRAIGPGHPLAEGMNPRSFIPCVAGPPTPRPLERPPVTAATVPPTATRGGGGGGGEGDGGRSGGGGGGGDVDGGGVGDVA